MFIYFDDLIEPLNRGLPRAADKEASGPAPLRGLADETTVETQKRTAESPQPGNNW